MRVVFSNLQNCADFSDGDFRDGGSAFQHVGPETAKAREPYVTVLVCGKAPIYCLAIVRDVRRCRPTNHWRAHSQRSHSGGPTPRTKQGDSGQDSLRANIQKHCIRRRPASGVMSHSTAVDNHQLLFRHALHVYNCSLERLTRLAVSRSSENVLVPS